MSERDTKEDLAMLNKGGGANSETCESTVYIPMTISTPISLEPVIRELPITVSSCGEPVLEQRPCGRYILTQELCVKVPIEISIASHIGNTPPCCDTPIESSAIRYRESYWGRS